MQFFRRRRTSPHQGRPATVGGLSLSALPKCTVVPDELGLHAATAGYLPNMQHWKRADIVLFRHQTTSVMAKTIEVVMRSRYAAAAARWTHAALHVGDGTIIEAVADGSHVVRRAPTSQYVKG